MSLSTLLTGYKGTKLKFAHDIAQRANFYGIALSNQEIYHWFEISEQDNLLIHDHSYNCNTGRVYKSFKYGFNIAYKIKLMLIIGK